MTATELQTVTEIAAQPTAIGRTINALTRFGDRLYPGYGDYGANTGPMHLLGIDTANPTAVPADEATFRSEQISVFRHFGADLYVPAMDPQGFNDATTGDAIASSGTPGVWAFGASFDTFPTHLFDVVQTIDGLWISGAREGATTGAAVIWRSTDDGLTYTESLAETAPTFGDGNSIRFYSLLLVGDDMYAQASGEGVWTPDRSWKWDHLAGAWQQLAPWSGLLPGGAPWRPRHRPDGTVLLITPGASNAETTLSHLCRFDPAGPATSVVLSNVLDYAIAQTEDAVYVLTLTALLRSTDLVTWTQVALAPSNATSIAVESDGSKVWYGTADSTIWACALT